MELNEDVFKTTKIYNFILTKVKELREHVLKMQLSDREVKEKQGEIKDGLDSIVNKLEKKIKELENNSEWDRFTVAFYGETNAGKSTLIETLRIMLNEKEKLKDREKYKEIEEHINSLKNQKVVYDDKIKEIVRKYEQALDSIMENLKNSEIELNDLKENLKVFQDLDEEFQEELNEIKKVINKERSSSFKNFILWLLKKLPEQQNLPVIKDKIKENNLKIKEIETSEKTINKKIEKINKETSTLENNKNKEINEHDKQIALLDKKIQDINKELEKYCDGKIIGDGSSDYTRDVTDYEIEYNGEKFCLLDLPGIEGNEKLVLDNINKAVKKSHAVFYISASPNPPQSGDKENSGTIEKIKKHLGDQTEVYFIYNKKIKNPKILKEALIDNGEEESLKETDKILNRILDTQYSGNISLSAYPAFLAVGNCYNRDETSKIKFLESLSVQNILSVSQVEKFKNWLTEKFVTNTKNKIIKANGKKLSSIIDKTASEIEEQNNILNNMRESLERNSENTESNLDNVLLRTKNKFRTELDYSLNEFEQNLRAAVYAEINRCIDNTEFKQVFESKYEEYSEILSSNLQTRFEGINEEFKSEVRRTLEEHNKTRKELIKTYNTRYSIEEKFNFNFEIKSDINKVGLIISVGSAIAGIIIAISNPAGWIVMGLAILSGIVSIFKSIWGFFDNDYRAGQQRNTTDSKIAEMKESLRREIDGKLPEINENLNTVIKEIKDSLSTEIREFNGIIDTFEKVKNEFYELSLDIQNKNN